MEEKLLSTVECAARKGISRQAIADAIKRGDIPAIKVGRSYVVKESDCDAYQPLTTPEERGKLRWKNKDKSDREETT